MPKTRKQAVWSGRLAPADSERCREIAKIKNQSLSSLVRDALLAYVENFDKDKVNVLEGIYAQQVKASANRTCALLAKDVKYSLATYFFLRQIDKELMDKCTGRAVKMVGEALQADEKILAGAMSNEVTRYN